MFLNKELNNVDVVCINTLNRKDRKKRIIQQLKNKKIPFRFYTTKLNKDPKRGCLESHLNVIQEAIKRGNKYLIVFEDDIKIIRSLLPFPKVPENWDMLYFGGTVQDNLGNYDENWTRVATWTCHAYIINLQNKEFLADFFKVKDYDKEIDEYLMKNIHYKYNCYMLNPMRIIQRDDYSDIEKQNVSYNFMESTLEGFIQPDFENTPNGGKGMKMDFIPPELLPNVSIITPTYNRRKIFSMAIRNFQMIEYPADKLEWIIIDDTPETEDSVEDILPKDYRIRYIHIKTKEKINISHKRNMGVKEAKYDYIVHMDDDDYYLPGSVMFRIKALMQYSKRGVGCVGCSRTGSYDIMTNKSNIVSDGFISLSEASMAYTKKFWEKQQFNELDESSEYRSFIKNRFREVLDMPYSYIIISITHTKNITGNLRKVEKNKLINKKTGEDMNFYDTFDEETKVFIDYLRKNL